MASFIITFISGRSVVLAGVQGNTPQIFCLPKIFFGDIFSEMQWNELFRLKLCFEHPNLQIWVQGWLKASFRPETTLF